MTAWAAGKFAGDDVGMFVKKCGIADKIKHQELIIPGYAAAIAGDVEEELPGWTITVGPREAAHKNMECWNTGTIEYWGLTSGIVCHFK